MLAMTILHTRPGRQKNVAMPLYTYEKRQKKWLRVAAFAEWFCQGQPEAPREKSVNATLPTANCTWTGQWVTASEQLPQLWHSKEKADGR